MVILKKFLNIIFLSKEAQYLKYAKNILLLLTARSFIHIEELLQGLLLPI